MLSKTTVVLGFQKNAEVETLYRRNERLKLDKDGSES